MKKQVLTLLCMSAMFLASCGGEPTPSASGFSSGHASGLSLSLSSSSEAATSFPEVSDVPIESGDYLQGSKVYRLDKAKKTLKIIDYDYDYNKYKNDQGTLVNDYTVKFVQIGEDAAVYYGEDQEGYYYLKQSGTSVRIYHIHGGGISYTNMGKFPTLYAPTYGNYVCTQAQTQYKVDGEGKRIPDESGGYVRETFYLFLELSETSAKLFVGENAETHREEPLHSIENYSLRYNAGGTNIRIPHKNGEYNCSLTIMANNEIKFNNSTEKDGDYSGSGTFTLIPAVA